MAVAKSVKMLSFILGAYFVIMGLNKMGPWFSIEMHRSLKTQHKELFKGSFFKLVVQQRMEVSAMLPSLYRQIMSINEITCGVLLLMVFLPLAVGNLANILLFLQYSDYLFSNVYVGSKFDKSGSVAVFLILLAARMILVFLTRNATNEVDAERLSKRRSQQSKSSGDTKGKLPQQKSSKAELEQDEAGSESEDDEDDGSNQDSNQGKKDK